MKFKCVVLLLWLGICSVTLAAAETKPVSSDVAIKNEAIKVTGIDAGIVVHLGSSDGALEAELASGGRMLVHGLALDNAAALRARATIASRGLYGLASIEQVTTLDRLPYADNQIDLLIADLNAITNTAFNQAELAKGAPAQTEILRVLRPKGVALLRRDGDWKRTEKPQPAGLGEWTHFDGPVGGGFASSDKTVQPPNQIQWVASDVRVEWWGKGYNPATYSPGPGIRVAGRRTFYWGQETERLIGDKKQPANQLVARGASNGIRLWTLKTDTTSNSSSNLPRSLFAADESRVYTRMPADGKQPQRLAIIDAATGKPLANVADALPTAHNDKQKTPGEMYLSPYNFMRLAGPMILQSAGYKLVAMDAVSGTARWTFDGGDGVVAAIGAVPAENRVYVVVHDGSQISPWLRGIDGKNTGMYDMHARWVRAKARSVVALDLKTGKTIWTCDEIAGHLVGQVIPHQDKVVVFGATRYGMVGVLNAADGKLLWLNTPSTKAAKEASVNPYNAVVRDDGIYIHYYGQGGGTRMAQVAWKDGAVSQTAPTPLNSRCMPLTATPGWLTYGLGWWVAPDGTGTMLGIARAGCATPAVAAHGAMFYSPNSCHCINQLRGYCSYTYEEPHPVVADEKRLEKSLRKADGIAPSPSKLPDSPIVAEWNDGDWNRRRPQTPQETAPVTVGGVEFVAVTHQHLIEARREGKVLWSFTTDGRITSTPLVHENAVYVGGDDGWLYCLDAADGTMRWRFFGAPWHRKLLFNGQLISTWPISEVVLCGGKVCFAAGLHAELAGGIRVYGLDPKNGTLAWSRLVERRPLKFAPPAATDTKPKWEVTTVDTHPPMNNRLKADGDKLLLGLNRDDDRRGELLIDPAQSQADLDRMVNAPTPKGK